MTEVTRGQLAEFGARVLTQTNWGVVDGRRFQDKVINLSPEEFGRRLTLLIQNDCQLAFGSPPALQLPAAFNLTDLFGNNSLTIWRGDKDGKGLEGPEEIYESAGFSELRAEKMFFEHFLNDGENVVGGELKLVRANESGRLLLGGRSCVALWLDYKAKGENSVLEWLRKNKGITWMDFPGLVLRHSNGYRYMLFLYFNGRSWNVNCHWLNHDWNRNDLSAVLEQVSKVL